MWCKMSPWLCQGFKENTLTSGFSASWLHRFRVEALVVWIYHWALKSSKISALTLDLLVHIFYHSFSFHLTFQPNHVPMTLQDRSRLSDCAVWTWVLGVLRGMHRGKNFGRYLHRILILLIYSIYWYYKYFCTVLTEINANKMKANIGFWYRPGFIYRTDRYVIKWLKLANTDVCADISCITSFYQFVMKVNQMKYFIFITLWTELLS